MRRHTLIVVAAGLALLGGVSALYFASRRPAAPAAGQEGPAPTAIVRPTPAASPRVAPRTPASRSAARAPTLTPAPDAAPTTGTLIIESDVPDTSVFVDRVYLGNAPVTATDLTPGPHRINASASGYDGYLDTIEVAVGTHTLSVKFKEVKLDATLAAVHKHAFGSCTGVLHATPQGLTYDTSNKTDGFTVALTDLETFTMDYLEKNLRVKIKGGKTYNFTDPEGNADRLYLFHQEVEKARQRLISGR